MKIDDKDITHVIFVMNESIEDLKKKLKTVKKSTLEEFLKFLTELVGEPFDDLSFDELEELKKSTIQDLKELIKWAKYHPEPLVIDLEEVKKNIEKDFEERGKENGQV